MKKFIYKSVFIIVVCFILISLVNLTIIYLLTPSVQIRTDKSHMANVPISIEKLKHRESPCVILIGGSNVGFGINSELIENEIGQKVVNAAGNAQLGLMYQIQLVKEHLREGDIVVISPEYTQFYGLLYGDGIALWIASIVNRNNIIYDLPLRCLWYMKIAPSIIYEVIDLVLTDYKSDEESRNIDYSISALNRYGDCILNREENKIYNGIDSRLNIEDFDLRAVHFLAEFSRSCIDSNIELVLLPPVYQESSYIKNEHAINLVDNALKDAKIPFYSSPLKYRFADSLFYDTYYHLNDKGIPIRTGYIIDDIRHLIKD